MKRLFLSLYFGVVLALALIGWSSEQLWQMTLSSSDNDIARIAQLSKAVRMVDDLEDQAKRRALSQQLAIEVRLMAMDDIAWLPSQQATLAQGDPVLMYTESDHLLVYLGLLPHQPNQVLALGPISMPTQNKDKKRLLLLLSYVLLAFAIALWSWPLWRDLKVLQQATESFGTGRFNEVPKVGKNSVIAPVVQTFKTMAERISRLVEEQKELTNAVSHELRTPLSRLKFSQALGQNPDPGMAQDIKELEALIDEMLSYSRLESTARQLVIDQVDVNQLVEHLLEKLSVNSDKRLQLKVAQPILWRCDGHFLERAVQNLVTNALRYADVQVEVSLSVTGQGLMIAVEDDGPGIAPEQFDEVFKPFVRLDKSRAKDDGGFGLGLAIVQRIVQWHQGDCKVAQAKLGGARFELILPQR